MSAGSGAPAVAARAVVKQFRDRHGGVVKAVDGLDLAVPPGQILAFLGPNGAGKTTTLDMVVGLTAPTSGTIEVCGMTPRAAVRAGRVSAVLQSGGLLADLTVAETVRLIASTFPSARPAGEVIERAGLTSLAARRVSKCSGGEQQRLRFALALLPDPDLLILDEPTAGMDVAARREFWATMQADARAGRTVIFATHYLEEADAFAERIVMVAGGRMVADGSVSEIRARGAGRRLSVRLPEDCGEDWIAGAERRARLTWVETRGGRAYFTADDTDAAAVALLTELGAHHLEITPPTLDSAFVALTGRAPGTARPEPGAATTAGAAEGGAA